MKNNRNIILKTILLLAVSILLFNCKSSKPRSTNKPTNKTSSSSKSLSPKVTKVIKEARSYTGVKYKYGGMTKSGLDCSGLMCKSYESVGLKLPRTTSQQYSYGKRIYIGELQPGDMVFFGTSSNKSKVTHVGLITEKTKSKDYKFIHTSSSKGVREDILSQDYWKKRYLRAVRPW